MRVTRAFIGAFGAGTSLAIAGSVMLLIVSSVVAFNGWPNDLAGTTERPDAALTAVASSSTDRAAAPTVALPAAPTAAGRQIGPRERSQDGRSPLPSAAGVTATSPGSAAPGSGSDSGEAGAPAPAPAVTPDPVRETVQSTADTVRDTTQVIADAVPSAGSTLESVGAAGAETVEQVGALLP